MRIILITAHLPRLIAQSKFRKGLPVYNGLIFYYFNDNFVQYTFKLFALSYWENRLPASEAGFHYSVSNQTAKLIMAVAYEEKFHCKYNKAH